MKTIGLTVIAILIASVILISCTSHADAASSAKKSPQHKYSKWTKKVCGDVLCDDSFSRVGQYIGKSRTPR
ncbi:MAG: hypothetical protein EB150_05500 [Nitrososphaeria archaeon]|nr:hypothetical protein [Nitrosopumilaceae archaeon]NDB62996.1 hypothetical protein [Nitrosopumilaceae archaeon]NDB89624.1 hypothetical protein [Nitrososphaerota archaeon]NDF29648.1 hypothetical protein [Nitrososphaeria archaeon]NDF35168.1 hypothetical protein [Nitrosopumilaceae archaeon]